MTRTTGRLLPDRARIWAEALAPREVVGVSPIGGGIPDTTWVLQLAGGGTLVVWSCDPQVWGSTGREHVRREALGCELLAGSGLPVPQLLASDLDGGGRRRPANLLTWRPGRVRLDRLSATAIAAWARTPTPPASGRSATSSGSCPTRPTSWPPWHYTAPTSPPVMYGRGLEDLLALTLA